MTQELLVLSTLCGLAVAVAAMFLPALVELWKPKDAGPRLIAENLIPSLGLKTSLPPNNLSPIIIDIEGEDKMVITCAKLLSFLPNLESWSVE